MNEEMPLVTDVQVYNFWRKENGFALSDNPSPAFTLSTQVFIKAQQAADLAIFEAWKAKRLEYEKKMVSELIEHALRDERLKEAEWLEGVFCQCGGIVLVRSNKFDDVAAHIAALRAIAGDSTNVKITWPNERYHLDGGGCERK